MVVDEVLDLQKLKDVEKDLVRFRMYYKFGLEEIWTKINILNEEFQHIHDHNPIEHIKTRIKSPESILDKLKRNNLDYSLETIEENIRDIAGLRIVCSFVSDIYLVAKMIQSQADLKLIDYKDYIKNPKPNGYQSLHMILEVPVFLSDRIKNVPVEVQLRTIGMDFWASLEHKIYYKYEGAVPENLKSQLKETADVVSELDRRMETLNDEVHHKNEKKEY